MQTVFRLILFHAADTGTGPLAVLLHVALTLSLLCMLCLLLSLLAVGNRFAALRAAIAVLLVASIHTILTLFDLYQAVFINLTGHPAPTLIIFYSPLTSLSLLDNIGISPYRLGSAILLLFGVHILLYWPLRHLLPEWCARLGRARFSLGRARLSGRLMLAAASIGSYVAVGFVPLDVRAGEPVLEGLRPVFQIAPPALLAAARSPASTARRLPRQPAPAGSRPLVLIVVDALRRDRMGLYNPALRNTPFLSSLDAQGKLRKFDGYATCTFSFCGIMSILASRSWNDFGSRPETLVDHLASRSYGVHLVLAGQHATFGGLTNLLGGPITSISDQPPRTQPNDLVAIDALERLQVADARHTFLYLHLMSPHAGSFIQPAFRVTPEDNGMIGAYLFSPAAKAGYRQIYDKRVEQADDVIRKAFAMLARKGMLEDALIIITADHGQRTSEGGLLYHGGEADPPTLAVPLLVYDARAGTYPARPLASQIDVAPTFADAIGIAPAKAWRGIALQRPTRRGAVPVGTSESTGIVWREEDRALLYLCDRHSGKEQVTPLRPGAVRITPDLLVRARRLHRTSAAPILDPRCQR
ncbi:sulfatase-like hydrolase/transferase [Sphingosinicella sp. BN140058]|uniref:sulfatase-like hydrolase/transferase n=1 Tax=Sphingosinicella sp. BN140058 TaxID=1892855 RepID=UPI0013EA3867|nr:sulfatase-like hydrolase/transferase [Sphingosinicella sp. BN140058]